MDNKLTKEALKELQKDFMSKSVQLDYSEGDTDGSTKGSMSIKSHNQFLDAFPQIIPIHDKYKQSIYVQNSEKKKRRRLSLTAIPVLEENEQDTQEKTEDNYQFPHLNLVKDHQEFSNKLEKMFGSDQELTVQTKLRTYSVDKLEQVVEVDEQEEKLNKSKKQIYNLLDQNEFNCSTPTISRRLSNKKVNLNQGYENIIQEDCESEKNITEPKRKSWFSNEASPRYKMIDELEKKQFVFPQEQPEIEPIQEEKELAEPTQAEKIFESSIGKLHKESEIEQFKDESSLKETKTESMGLIKEMDDQLEDDCNHHASKKNK